MKTTNFQYKKFTASFLLLLLIGQLTAQPLCTPWGNINGIYIEGEKMEIETSIRSVNLDWTSFTTTEKYNWEGNQTYEKQGNTYTVSHSLQGLPLAFTVKKTETIPGGVKVELNIQALESLKQNGTYFCVEVSASDFESGSFTFFKNGAEKGNIELTQAKKDAKGELIRIAANKVVLNSADRQYEILSGNLFEIVVRQDFIDPPAHINDAVPVKSIVTYDSVQKTANYQLYFTLINGFAKKGMVKHATFEILTRGKIDREDVTITIDTKKPGRPFEGIGGNFRLQFPDKDPEVIKYCLDSLDVNWARVPLFWDEYHPSEKADPNELLLAGKLSDNFYQQIELTKELAQYGSKMILAIWAPPAWAVDSTIKVAKGVVLDNKKLDRIGESIAAYLMYLKREHGITIEYFSFNEPDYGVEVYQTVANHAIQNKAIGLCFAKHGLTTKILIADTGSGTAKARNIISEIEQDPQMHQYSGAIAFHTYHGCTNSDLLAWADAANKNNLPIMVAEGGTNSAAHRFPMVFLEPWFQLEEIDYYIRICNICQPVTILEWQLTADYSPLIGKGLYDDNGPLRPTQRFWNLKQLGLTPFGSFALPAVANSNSISAAAFGHIMNNYYTVHLVNNGAKRKIIITGLPENLTTLIPFITNAHKGMEKGKPVKIIKGTAEIEVDAQSYVTLINIQNP